MADAFAIFDTIWMIIKYGWWLVVLLGVFYVKMRNKNYPIEAIIVEKRGNNLIKTNDRVGKYVDKYSGLISYKFMKTKDTIPVVDFEWIMSNNRQDLGLMDKLSNKLWGNAGTAFFFKYGSRQYKPIKTTVGEDTKIEWEEVKDKDGNTIKVSIIKPIDPRDKMAGLNFEVVDWDNMNFMVQEQRASIERRKKKSEFWKQILLPAMLIGGAVVVSIVMIKFGYDFAIDTKNTNQQVPKADPTNPNIPIIGDLLPT
jgi:hypothetical protein